MWSLMKTLGKIKYKWFWIYPIINSDISVFIVSWFNNSSSVCSVIDSDISVFIVSWFTNPISVVD